MSFAPYIGFSGQARKAMTAYAAIFGATDLQIMGFGEGGMGGSSVFTRRPRCRTRRRGFRSPVRGRRGHHDAGPDLLATRLWHAGRPLGHPVDDFSCHGRSLRRPG